MSDPLLPSCETLTVEFKREWTKDTIPKTLVAFANTAGGDLYIGVDDTGHVVGVEDPDAVRQSLASVLADRIFPSVFDCITDETLTIRGKYVVHIHVLPGPRRPYGLDVKNAGSVYIRSGNTTRPARIEEICRIARESDLVPFEERISLEQHLTFETLKQFCWEADFDFNPVRNRQYGLWNADRERYTNLAFLLSDQCTFGTVVAEFSDDEKLHVVVSRRFEGSVLTLLSDGMRFLSESNLIGMEFPTDGRLQRQEIYAVPPSILREALVNAVAHRDYNRTVATAVHVSPSNVEIFTGGGLAGLEADEVLSGFATDCRNKHLAQILGRLHLMEGIGNGFRQIRLAYPQMPMEKLLTIRTSSFTITLPRRQSVQNRSGQPQEDGILDYLVHHPRASRQELQDVLGCSQATCSRRLKTLAEQGKIDVIGNTRNRRYSLTPKL